MGVSNAYVTVNTGASHKRGCTVDNTSHPVGCDVSEELARIMRCNSIPLGMSDADYTSTGSQRQGVMTLGVRMTCVSRPSTSSVLRQACTHDAGALGRRRGP